MLINGNIKGKIVFEKDGSMLTNGKLNSPGIGVSWYYTKDDNVYKNCVHGYGNNAFADSQRSKPNLSDFDECLSPDSDSDNSMNLNVTSIKNYNDNTSNGLILESWDGSKHTLYHQ